MNCAVLVGINQYPYPNALNGCLNDVSLIEAEIENALGFPRSGIQKLLDTSATANAIRNTLREAVSQLHEGDKFLFWYSGHGAQLVDGDIATDVICPVDFEFTPETSVTVSDFHAIFAGIPAGVIAVWGSDSCHSGDLLKDRYNKGVPKQYRWPPSAVHVTVAPKRFSHFRDILICSRTSP